MGFLFSNLTAFGDLTTVPLYRSWNGNDHIYTTDVNEWNTLVSSGYTQEKIEGFVLSEPLTHEMTTAVPLYRLWNGVDHFYTTNEAEKNTATASGYELEGIEGYVFTDKVLYSIPLYRLWNGVDHFYTTDEAEKHISIANGYRLEKIESYIFETTATSKPITIDSVSPVFIYPTNTVLYTNNPNGDVMFWDISAIDDVDGTVSVICDHLSGSNFPIGATTVSCSATDSAGNTNKVLFLISVILETTPPVISVPQNLKFEGFIIAGGQQIIEPKPTAFDDVDGIIIPECKSDSTGDIVGPIIGGSYSVPILIGINSITCTATDSTGNTATKSFTVTFSQDIPLTPIPDTKIIPKTNEGKLLSPKKQIEQGVAAEDVICKEGLELIIKNNDSSACVYLNTAKKMEQRGWGVIPLT